MPYAGIADKFTFGIMTAAAGVEPKKACRLARLWKAQLNDGDIGLQALQKPKPTGAKNKKKEGSMRNGRKNNELRKIKFTKNYTKHALGSVLVEFGDTKVITTASVDLSKPKWMSKDSISGWVSAEYSLLPSSTNTRCKRERTCISGRTQEIQRLIGRSLRACVNLEKMPDITIIVDADVIQADGGTRTASICGGFLALKDAVEKLLVSGQLKENPIIEPIAAISVGIVEEQIRLDLNYEEDSSAQADANVVLTKSGKIIEFQTTAEREPFSKKQMLEIFETATKGVKEIIKKY